MAVKLYRVDVVVKTVVLAESPEEATRTAEISFFEAADCGHGENPVEILDSSSIPEGWGHATPFYEGLDDLDEMDMTCLEIVDRFSQQREQEAEEFLTKAEQERRQLKLFPDP